MKIIKLFFVPFIVTLFGATHLFSQVQDSFDDGEFHNNPTWSGDTSCFKVNSSRQLQLKGVNADTSFVSTMNNKMEKCEWTFWVKLSFNTSSNNFARAYLVSDQQNLKGPLNGYFLQIGGSEDSLKFYKQKGVLTEELFSGNSTTTSGSTNVFRIKIVYDSVRVWHLFTDNTGGNLFKEEGNFADDECFSTQWFGFFCKYTSSNSGKFYFDDVSIAPIQIDTTPPYIVSVKVTGDKQLETTFSEPVNTSEAENIHNYSTFFSGNPIEARVISNSIDKVILTFSNAIQEGTYDTLRVASISDLSGNYCQENKIPFTNYKVKSYDIVISEIMADPGPAVGLPVVEYVELYNRTKFPINLKDWFFQYGSHSKFLPEKIVNSEDFIILTQGDSLSGYGSYIDLFTSSSSLLNDGCSLILQDNYGKIIHSLNYDKSWHSPSFKEGGGWSLEMRDPGNPCGCKENWGSSESAIGGTPCKINSLDSNNPDLIYPYLKAAKFISDHTVEVQFSEAMDFSSLSTPNTFFIDNEIGFPDSVNPVPPFYNKIDLWFQKSFVEGKFYELRSNRNPTDCVNNKLDTIRTVYIAIPEQPAPGNIVINEILSDPYVEGERFIELYNRSKNVLDMSDVLLARLDPLTGSPNDPVELVSETVLFFPGDYCLLTKDPDDILGRYFSSHPEKFIKLEALPTYDNDQDVVVILRKNDNIIIDQVNYSKEMHSPLIVNTEGISLERINPNIGSEETTNWHSAASCCGFATPAYQNSQFREEYFANDWIEIRPQVISPDNDGIDDVLQISFMTDISGYSVSADIFDDTGIKVKQLIKNLPLGAMEQVIWDGTGRKHEKLDVGIYVLIVTFIHPDGEKWQVKKAVVISGKS